MEPETKEDLTGATTAGATVTGSVVLGAIATEYMQRRWGLSAYESAGVLGSVLGIFGGALRGLFLRSKRV